jgi:threonine/homoserine/homoserine lactone efflux protein
MKNITRMLFGEFMVFKGFRFGMLLQLAVGPICIYIFKLAIETSLIEAMIAIVGVVIIDGLFIALSILGISSLVNKNERILKIGGAVVLVVFGIMTIYGAIVGDIVTDDMAIGSSYLTSFVKAIVLTGANPLTIIFWSGVFSARIIEERFSRRDEIRFGFGAVLSTLITLTVVAIVGQFTSSFISKEMVTILNIVVGLILIYFGLRLALKKAEVETE